VPATSGSPTQNRTSVANVTELAGVPVDQFASGDLAWVDNVSLLGSGATYRFRRGAPPSPPDNLLIVSAFGPGLAYWELFLGQEGPVGPVGPQGAVGPLDVDISELLSQILCELRKMRL